MVVNLVWIGQSSLNTVTPKYALLCYSNFAEFHPQNKAFPFCWKKNPITFRGTWDILSYFPMTFHRPEAPLVDEWAFVPATDIFLVVGEACPPVGVVLRPSPLKCWHFGALKKTSGIFFWGGNLFNDVWIVIFFQIFSLTENVGGKWASLTNFGFKPFGSIWAHFKPQSRKGSYVGKLHLSLVQTQWPNFHRFSTSNVFLFSWLIFHLVVKITVNIQHFGSKTLHF